MYQNHQTTAFTLCIEFKFITPKQGKFKRFIFNVIKRQDESNPSIKNKCI